MFRFTKKLFFVLHIFNGRVDSVCVCMGEGEWVKVVDCVCGGGEGGETVQCIGGAGGVQGSGVRVEEVSRW